MTPADLTRLRQLHEAATAEPWTADVDRDRGSVEDILASESHVVCFGHGCDEYGYMTVADAELIVAMRNALPDLLAYAEAQTDMVTLPRELVGRVIADSLDFNERTQEWCCRVCSGERDKLHSDDCSIRALHAAVLALPSPPCAPKDTA